MAVVDVAERLVRFSLNARGVTSRTVETSVAPLHVYDARGRGRHPTLAVLHGFGSTASAYAQMLQALLPHVKRIVAPEAPSHGFSGAPREALSAGNVFAAIAEVLDRELTEPAVVIGNSLGGGMALRYALERPGRVRALVLSSPAGARVDEAVIERLRGVFRFGGIADAREFLARLYHRVPWYAPLFASHIHRTFRRDDMRGFLDAVGPDDMLDPAALRALEIPILMVWGESDRIMPRACLDFFRANLPAHAAIEELAGVGHCPHFERPQWMVRRIVRFLDSINA